MAMIISPSFHADPGEITSIDTVRKRSCRMSRSEAKFIAEMIKSHGTNYKVGVPLLELRVFIGNC